MRAYAVPLSSSSASSVVQSRFVAVKVDSSVPSLRAVLTEKAHARVSGRGRAQPSMTEWLTMSPSVLTDDKMRDSEAA